MTGSSLLVAQPTKERLLESLHDQNPWWRVGQVPPALAKPFRRRDFFFLRNRLDGPPILGIYGPRQVGKTTLMYQLAHDLIAVRKVDPRRVLFYSFDYPGTSGAEGELLNLILETYSTSVLKEPIGEFRSNVYVLLDEVSKAEGWSRLLKGWYDLRHPIKFVVSDSSQSHLLRDAARDLVGRISLQLMLPFKFSDFLAFRLGKEELSESTLRWRDRVADSLRGGSPAGVLSTYQQMAEEMVPLRRRAHIQLERYLLADGFPELIALDDLALAASRLRQYVDLTIYRDLVRLFEIRNPKALDELVGLIASDSGQRANYHTLGKTLGLKYETLRTYLDYLESVFLVGSSEFYTKSRAKRIRRPKKLYFRNCGLRNAITGELHEGLLADPGRLGLAVETMVFDHALRLAYHTTKVTPPKVFYWQDANDREVDMVLDLGTRPLAIEVKYRGEVRKEDMEALSSFLKERPEALGLLVTRGTLDRRGGIVLVPLWLFLMAC